MDMKWIKNKQAGKLLACRLILHIPFLLLIHHRNDVEWRDARFERNVRRF